MQELLRKASRSRARREPGWTSPRPRRYSRTTSGLYLIPNVQLFGVPTLLGRGLLPSDALEGQDRIMGGVGYKFGRYTKTAIPDIVGKNIR